MWKDDAAAKIFARFSTPISARVSLISEALLVQFARLRRSRGMNRDNIFFFHEISLAKILIDQNLVACFQKLLFKLS